MLLSSLSAFFCQATWLKCRTIQVWSWAMLRTASLQIFFFITAPRNDVCRHVPHFCSRCCLTERSYFLFPMFSLIGASQEHSQFLFSHCCCLARHSYCLCSRFLPSLLARRAFRLSMFPIFLPHCCLTDRSYCLCSRFLTSLLPHRPFLFSMFPIFDPIAASQSIPIFYVPDFLPSLLPHHRWI